MKLEVRSDFTEYKHLWDKSSGNNYSLSQKWKTDFFKKKQVFTSEKFPTGIAENMTREKLN